ncbi:MAG TPA: hypothetical protein VHG27_04150 [Xanthobacteraceae bacterium]|nr:hypothetical protein [Xanthobacteraceae bacterium]
MMKKSGPQRINWLNLSTAVSAAILIGAEVFGAAYAGGWAVGILFGMGEYGIYIIQVVFFLAGIFTMAAFMRGANQVEPFLTRD